MPPSLELPDAQVASCFANRNDDSARQLASLINNCSPNSLDIVIKPILQQLHLYSSNEIRAIDSLLQYLSLVASFIEPTLESDGAEGVYGSTNLRPSSGPGILAERLSHNLHESLWELTSRSVTPNEEDDEELGLDYYRSAAAYGTALARAFATQPTFREAVWREVEDVFVKGLFSYDPEPGAYIALTALFLGAGREIKDYLEEGHVGQGKDWLWYDDVRIEKENTWGWLDVVTTLASVPAPGILPSYVRSSFALAKEFVGNGQGDRESWDSHALARTAFHWAQNT